MPPLLQQSPPASNPASTAATPAATWSPAEQAAWAPPEQIDAAQWAESRELSKRQTSRPGPWRNANQPAAVGLMVLACLRVIREIWLKKSGQFGASEASATSSASERSSTPAR
jgi:hypothetical protein